MGRIYKILELEKENRELKAKRTKKGLIAHELSSIISSILKIDEIVERDILFKEINIETNKIDFYVRNIDKLIKIKRG